MKKNNLPLVFAALLLILCGCSFWEQENDISADNDFITSTDKTWGEVQNEVGLKSGKKSEVSFAGTLNVWSGPIGSGSEISLVVEGTGTLSHMGRTTLSMKKTVNTYAYPLPPQPWSAVAEAVLTSARGDELHFFYGDCPVDRTRSPLFIFKTTGIISGGTGRYENVYGNIEYHEQFSWSQSIGILELEGTINFQ